MSTSCSGDVPAASGATSSFFLELSGDGRRRHSTCDLYELVWGGEGIAALSPPALPPEVVALSQCRAPSEDEMAAWLHAVVTGGQEQQYFAGGGGDDGPAAGVQLVAADRAAVPAEETNMPELMTEKLPATGINNFNCTGQGTITRKSVRGARRASYAESHSQTEKRRRCKINQRLKTLQQLVPGCGETNQISTLEQTIRYVKSLQQQLQAMAAAAAGYYGTVRPVLCTAGGGIAVPPMPVAAVAGQGRGCVMPGQGLFMGPIRWPSVWASVARPPPACITDGGHGPA